MVNMGLVGFTWAQISGSFQTSYQLGNLPESAPQNRSNLYNQVNLQYTRQNIFIGLRAENYMVDEPFDYTKVSRKYVRYSNNNLQVTAGNFFEILGRGVLLRSYEVPGSIYEDGSTRQRYAFYKDIEGFSLQYSTDILQSKLFYGRALDNVLPPAFGSKNRRAILVQGGEIDYTEYSVFQPGILFLRSEQDGLFNEYAGFNAQGFFNCGLQYYAEYSQNLSSEYDILDFSKETPYGFYSSLSYSIDFVSTSLEYKDYNRYGLVFNDPPPLVREHSYSLLNRSTHSIEPENEKGYQLEFLFNIGDLNTATLNHAASENDFGSGKVKFYEYYADINYYPFNNDWLTKGFIDFAHDELRNERNRKTFGMASEDRISGLWSYSAEVQYQEFERSYIFNPQQDHAVTNILWAASFNHAPDFSIGLNLEQSNDPLDTNTLISGDKLKRKYWYGFDLTYQYDSNNTLALFYGERRGGYACSGGICYQVQPFKGLEFRLNTRF